MSEKEPTQAMPREGHEGAPDGTNRPPKLANGEPSGGDAGSGGRYPNQPDGSGETFHGGQSRPAYHGTSQLGGDEVSHGGDDNADAES